MHEGDLRHERAFAGKADFYERLVEKSPDMIARFTPDLRYSYVNTTLIRTLGFEGRDIIGLTPLEIATPEKNGNSRFIQASLSEVLKTGHEHEVEHEITLPSGEKRCFTTKIVLEIDENGKISSLTTFSRDITDRKKIEEERIEAQKDVAIKHLVAGVAHNSNNRLAVILGYVEMMLMGEVDPEKRESLDQIKAAAESDRDMVKELLTYVRKEKNVDIPANLSDIANSILGKLQHTVEDNIVLESNLAEDTVVSGDPVQIEQIIVGLCENAREAMPNGGKLRIGTQNIYVDKQKINGNSEAKAGEYAVLEISDTGYGMSEEVRRHMFDPFFTTKGLGEVDETGLTLAVISSMVTGHNGFIKVESEPNRGTTIKVYFPKLETKTSASSYIRIAENLSG